MKTSKNFKLVLADDHVLLRDALAGLIDKFDEFTIVDKVANGQELIESITNGIKPDILLMDLNMPKMDGYETARWVTQHRREIKIVILTMYDTEVAMIRLLQMGVCGFLKKDIHPQELKNALLTIAEGGYYYSNHYTLKLASLFKKDPYGIMGIEKVSFTDQEIEFLKLSCTDKTYKQIAEAMNLSHRHIDNYRDSLFTKLGVESRVGLAIYAVKNGIVVF